MEQDHIHENKDNPLYYGQYKKTTDRRTEMITLKRPIQEYESKAVSVERSNAASVKTITKNGGKYERSFTFGGEEADVYIIRLV